MSARRYRLWAALCCELVRRLWQRSPKHRSHPLLNRIHAYCFSDWVAWRTAVEMRAVDMQIADIHKQWEEQEPTIPEPLFSEELEGDSLLGGELRLTSPWHKDDPS